MTKIKNTTEVIVKIIAIGALLVALIMAFAAAGLKSDGEASTGDFKTFSYNEGWVLSVNGASCMLELPREINAQNGDVAILKNVLPDNIHDGMSLAIRSTMADAYIYINGELREEYSSDSLGLGVYYLPSAYVVAELGEEDAGADVEVRFRLKSRMILNGITISNGDNFWFEIIKSNIAVNFVALMSLILGVIMVVITIMMSRSFEMRGTVVTLGLLMIDMSIYVISESGIRQLFFSRPSLSVFFTFIALESLPVFGCMYFDEVHHKRYHKRYLAVEGLACLSFLINVALQTLGIAEFYTTLVLGHVWMIATILIALVNTTADVISHKVKEYIITSFGMVIFVVMCITELVSFYVNKSHSFGTSLCGGLVVLMAATVVQLVHDERDQFALREKKQTQMIVSTIETIASAIDAKDEYTGGHSERVGRYAGILAGEMAESYGFTDEDIIRIRYIGMLHDIGKIGVDDSVLNKAGKLTDEEYALMKKHVNIGYELMGSMAENVPGILEGIRNHHERYDGKGYPDGLVGENIPLIARILCLADCYDAMTSNRVYRKRLTDEEVKAELKRCSGSQFDPVLADMFIELINRGQISPDTVEGMHANADGQIPKASLLENRLQKDLHKDGIEVENPGHVRMMCYIAKLLENKGHRVNVYFASTVPKDLLSGYDMSIAYTSERMIVTLFDKNEEQIRIFEDSVSSMGGEIYMSL